MVDQHQFPLPLTSSPQFYPHFNATNPYSLPSSSTTPSVLMPADDVEATSGLLSQVDDAVPIFPPPMHDVAAVARHHAQLEEMLAPYPASIAAAAAALPLAPPPPPPPTTMPNSTHPSFPLNPFVPQVAHDATESFAQPPFPLMPFVPPAVPPESIAHPAVPSTFNQLNSAQNKQAQGVSPTPSPIGRSSASPATGGSACGSGSGSGSGSDGATRTQGAASDAWGVALAKLNASRIAAAKWEEEVAVRRPHFGTTEDKETKRKETNQKSAKISRLRIRAYVAELESVLEAGEQSTRKLKDEVREVEKESQQLETQLVYLRAQVSNVRNFA